MRILTSAELQRNADEYAAFVVHPETQESMPVVDFCHQFVEGMGKEAGEYSDSPSSIDVVVLPDVSVL